MYRSAPFEPSYAGFIACLLMWSSGPYLLYNGQTGLGLLLTVILAPLPLMVLAMLIGRARIRRKKVATHADIFHRSLIDEPPP